MAEKYNVLASKQNIKHNIKGDKEFTDSIQDGGQIMSLLKQYHIKYGETAFIKDIISSYANIKGGIAFTNSQGQLVNLIERYDNL